MTSLPRYHESCRVCSSEEIIFNVRMISVKSSASGFPMLAEQLIGYSRSISIRLGLFVNESTRKHLCLIKSHNQLASCNKPRSLSQVLKAPSISVHDMYSGK